MTTDGLETLQFALPASITLEEAPALAEALRALPLQENQALKLDASAVEVITTPGIQLILALGLSRAQHGGQLQLAAPSSALVDSFLALGLGAELQALEG
jgi:anti-anti-sigma regulatory factor